MVTDRVGDFIIRLKNAAAISKSDVSVPYSTHLLAIAKKLKELGFVTAVTIKEPTKSSEEHLGGSAFGGKENAIGVKKTLVVTLAYDEKGSARLRGVKRISKPGRRLYAQHTEAHRVRGGVGARLLTTSIGILTDAEARKNKVGGEELFEIW